jgi:hypothetical protein
MNRRELIALLGGTAVSWPVGARAQQQPVHRIGVLMSTGEHDREGNARLAAFRQGLQELGWDDRNLHIDVRWTASNPEEIRIRQRFNAAAARSRATQQSREAVIGVTELRFPQRRGDPYRSWRALAGDDDLERACAGLISPEPCGTASADCPRHESGWHIAAEGECIDMSGAGES